MKRFKLSDENDGRAENMGRTAFYNGRPVSDWKGVRPREFRGPWINGYQLARAERESGQ